MAVSFDACDTKNFFTDPMPPNTLVICESLARHDEPAGLPSYKVHPWSLPFVDARERLTWVASAGSGH